MTRPNARVVVGGGSRLHLGDASRNRASAARATPVVSRDDASPDGAPDLLTDARARRPLATLTRDLGKSALPRPGVRPIPSWRVRHRRSDIEAYEQAGFVTRPAEATSLGDPSDVRETVEWLFYLSVPDTLAWWHVVHKTRARSRLSPFRSRPR